MLYILMIFTFLGKMLYYFLALQCPECIVVFIIPKFEKFREMLNSHFKVNIW